MDTDVFARDHILLRSRCDDLQQDGRLGIGSLPAWDSSRRLQYASSLRMPDLFLPERFVYEKHTTASSQVPRSEEHTSELQSQSNLVCRLLLEKKKQKYKNQKTR